MNKGTLKRKKRVGGLTVSDFKAYSKAAVIQTMCYKYKNTYVDRWNRIEGPRIYGKLRKNNLRNNTGAIGQSYAKQEKKMRD